MALRTIGTCTPIYKYRIFTTRMLNKLCYFDFPVSLPHNNKTYFLHIPTRTLRLQSRRIPCQARPTKTYVTNPTNTIFSINRNGHTKINFGRALGGTIEAIAGGTSTIIQSLGRAMHQGLSGVGDLDRDVISSIANASGTILVSAGAATKDVTTGAGNFVHNALGGIGGTIKWVFILN